MGDIIWVGASVRLNLLKYRQEIFPLETGGVLLGYFTEDSKGHHWVITSATGPGPKAKHSRYHFTPDDAYHIQEATRHYHETGGREYYLGDWHTHPNGTYMTSMLDRLTLYRNARRADHLHFRSLMLIIGGEINSASYGAYVEGRNFNVLKIFGQNIALKPRFFR